MGYTMEYSQNGVYIIYIIYIWEVVWKVKGYGIVWIYRDCVIQRFNRSNLGYL